MTGASVTAKKLKMSKSGGTLIWELKQAPDL